MTFSMRSYNGISAQERLASYRKTKQAIAAGIIPPPSKCSECGQTQGRIDYHSEDYHSPTKGLVELCARCHLFLHCRFKHSKLYKEYLIEIAHGKMFPPILNFPKFFAAINRDIMPE